MSRDYLAEARAARGLAPKRARLTLAEIAARAGVTRRAVAYQVASGALKAQQECPAPGVLGWRWMVEPEEAERWIREYRWNARTQVAA